MSPSNPIYPIVNPNVIEAAMRQARRERSEAIWQLLTGSARSGRGGEPIRDQRAGAVTLANAT